jgi:hypothetical protein
MRGESLVSVMAYRSFGGEVEARTKPHDTLPYLFMPSPTFAHPLASPDARGEASGAAAGASGADLGLMR